MSILQLKSASGTMTQNSIDPLTIPTQMDMRRSPVPNRSIMSVLDHENETEDSVPSFCSTGSHHPVYEVREDCLSKVYSNSSDNSTLHSAGSNGRLSWTSTLNTPVTISGWLLKHNATHFTFTTPWKRYFYILADHALHEYKTDMPDSPHRDQFDLSSDTMVFVNEGFPGKSYILEIRKPGRRMCLQCTDVDNMKQWMHYLKKSISQMKRNDSIKSTAESCTRVGSHHSSNDITVPSHSPIKQDDTSSMQHNHNHTQRNKSQSSSRMSSLSSSSHLPTKPSEIPPQLPPPSRSPPPVPDAWVNEASDWRRNFLCQHNLACITLL